MIKDQLNRDQLEGAPADPNDRTDPYQRYKSKFKIGDRARVKNNPLQAGKVIYTSWNVTTGNYVRILLDDNKGYYYGPENTVVKSN